MYLPSDVEARWRYIPTKILPGGSDSVALKTVSVGHL